MLNVQSGEYAVDRGYPALILQVDGQRVILGVDIKLTILDELGAVPLGGAFFGKVPDIPIPWMTETVLRGFTTDPHIVGLYRRFLAVCETGTVTPGPVDVSRKEE